MSVREVIEKYHDKLEADCTINPIPTRVLDGVVIEVLELMRAAEQHDVEVSNVTMAIDEALEELRR